jgi:hypothetical protein
MKIMTVLRSRPAIIRLAGSIKRFLGNCMKLLILPLAVIIAACLRLVPGNTMYSIFYRNGFHLLRKHYYLPIPQEADLNSKFWEKRSELVGLEMNDTYAIGLLDSVFPLYLDEFRSSFSIHKSPADPAQFYLINSSFMAIDAHVYYIFIRHFKPKQIVEIGAGNSTVLAAAACRQNRKENGEEPRLTAIEPFPNALLSEGSPGLSQLIKQKVEDVNLELFSSLQSGDILFIDSTHVLRSGGDVQLEYCEILPRLAPGVLVHIHDISLPKPYPRVYFENQLYWNEQYLLQAFLCFNSRFEVIWPGNYMILKYPERVCNTFPEYHEMRKSYPMSEPSSFWMRVKA